MDLVKNTKQLEYIYVVYEICNKLSTIVKIKLKAFYIMWTQKETNLKQNIKTENRESSKIWQINKCYLLMNKFFFMQKSLVPINSLVKRTLKNLG